MLSGLCFAVADGVIKYVLAHPNNVCSIFNKSKSHSWCSLKCEVNYFSAIRGTRFQDQIKTLLEKGEDVQIKDDVLVVEHILELAVSTRQ